VIVEKKQLEVHVQIFIFYRFVEIKSSIFLMNLVEMFILWRYILKEHLGPFFFGLAIITLVFLLNIIFRELGRILSRDLVSASLASSFAEYGLDHRSRHSHGGAHRIPHGVWPSFRRW